MCVGLSEFAKLGGCASGIIVGIRVRQEAIYFLRNSGSRLSNFERGTATEHFLSEETEEVNISYWYTEKQIFHKVKIRDKSRPDSSRSSSKASGSE